MIYTLKQVWSSGKGHVARNNKTFKLDEVEELIKEGLSQVTQEQWEKYEDHVIKVEKEMWEKEHLVDLFHATHLPSVVILPYEQRSHDSDDEDEDCDCETEE